jgi:hypothetical protein
VVLKSGMAKLVDRAGSSQDVLFTGNHARLNAQQSADLSLGRVPQATSGPRWLVNQSNSIGVKIVYQSRPCSQYRL